MIPDRGLSKLGGAAAFSAVGLTLAEVIALAVYPPPAAVAGWFQLFQGRPLVGFLDFWGVEVPLYLMFVLVFLALFAALRNEAPGRAAVALTLALLGSGIFLATNNPFTMLSLSRQYAAAASEAQRFALLAAGQAVLAGTGQRAVGGFNLGLFLVSAAGLLVASVMLRSSAFSRSTAYAGILAFGLSMADYARQALTASPVAALLMVLPNVLFLSVWFSLVGQRLYRLGRVENAAT